MKIHSKRGMAFLLVLTVLVSLFTGSFSVSAMDLSQPYTVSGDHTLTDHDGNTFTWYGGIAADSNEFGHIYQSGKHSIHDYTVKRHGLPDDKTDWVYDRDYLYAFCIEPGVPFGNANDYMGSNNPNHGDKWKRLSAAQKDLIQLALSYGYPNRQGLQTSKDANACYAATQLIVWQIALGWRTSPTSVNDHSYPASGHSGTMTAQLTANKYLKAFYDAILADMAEHGTRPSFTGTALTAPVYELTETGGSWTLTLKDNKNVLSDYYVLSNGGVSASINGDTLTIRSSKPITSETQIILTRRMPSTNHTTGLLFWSVPGKEKNNQDMVTGVPDDPLHAYLKLKVSAGNLSIIKTTKNNGGQVGGFTFKVTKQNGEAVGTFKTENDGRILIPNLAAGWYRVEEINLSEDFVKPAQNPVEVQVKSGQTATVNFENIRKMGVITVQKVNGRPLMGDYSLAGAEFTVKDQSGNIVDTIITAADGAGQSKPLPLGRYTITETKAPYGFVIDKNVYSCTLSGSQGTAAIVYCPEITVSEQPQVGRVKITKQDMETAAQAQGDATLSGAVFELLDGNGKPVERLYCGDAESITSQEIPLGSYTVREVVPPRGYTLSQKEYAVSVDYAGQETEVSLKSVDVQNKVIKGQLAVIKHSDQSDPAVTPKNEQIQKPLENVVFRVWLKAAGTYEAAKPSERDEITTNENGWTITKPLPFGTYIVEEYKGLPEHKVCEPFEAVISEDGKTYYYNIENPAYSGKVKIVKPDATTGKTIPQAGVEFKVKNSDTGAWVEQEILYPTPAALSSYFTNAEGWLVMPEELPFGNYELWEVQSPYGYLLADQPVPFKITSENPADYLEVIMENQPVMGRVTVEKTGEVLTGADLLDGLYIPRYAVQGLPGAVFDIVARRDIVTPDGTLRLKAGAVADTVTTGANGKVESKLLFLGDYYARERKAPDGMCLNTEEHDFSLVYEGQTVPVVYTQTGVYNERQKAAVTLNKYCETPENAGEDFDPYSAVVFGLFARADILAADGAVAIPKDGLLEYLTFDRDGRAKLKTDLPLGAYYVKELKTGAGYALDEAEYDFSFAYAGQEVSTVEIPVNDGKTIENKLLRGNLKIVKSFEGRETPLAGIPFTIEGTTVAGTSVTLEAATDENGEILLENLLVGEYTVKELESELSTGYLLAEPQTVTVAIGEVAELFFENKLMRGDLRIIKTFEGKTTPLAGIKFTVTGETLSGETYTGEFETDEQGQIYIEGLPVGAYTVQELGSELTEGYLLSETQTVTVALEQITELQIENRLIRGSIKLVKTDKDSGAKLSGAVFALYAPDGEKLGEYITDENGELLIEELPYGTGYKLVERKAPMGYQLSEAVFTFDITENGKTIELSAVNEKIPPTPDSPQTGNNSNLDLWLVIMVASLGALVLLTLRRKHTDNR